MTIKTTTTKETELEIQLPIFWKYIDPIIKATEYLGVINNDLVISFYKNGSLEQLSHSGLDLRKSQISTAYHNWQQISKEEFMDAHDQILKGLALLPELFDNDPNDIKDVL